MESKIDRNLVQIIYAFQQTQKSIDSMKEMIKMNLNILKNILRKQK